MEGNPQALEPRSNPCGTVAQDQQPTRAAENPQLQQQGRHLQPQTLRRGFRERVSQPGHQHYRRVRPHLLATRRRLGLGFDLIGLNDHEALVDRAGLVLVHRERRLTPGKTRRYPLGKGLFPLGLGFLRVVEWQVVIAEPWHSVEVDYGGPEQGQLGFRRFVQDRAGTLALRDNQLLALPMHDVDDRAPSQQTLVPSGLANVGATRSRGSIAHLITDRVPEILGDGQLVGGVPDRRRWYFDRAVLVVADPRPLNGDFAEDGFEGERSCPPALDASTGFAVPVLENQFLIGLLDQDLKEPALDFETGLMNVRLNLVGEMLVLPWHGQGDLQRQFERERLAVRLDGAEGDDSLKTVGGTHGVSPYGYYGRCILRAFLSIR